jgi:hypothetical protein
MSFDDIYLLGNEFYFDGIICWATRGIYKALAIGHNQPSNRATATGDI